METRGRSPWADSHGARSHCGRPQLRFATKLPTLFVQVVLSEMSGTTSPPPSWSEYRAVPMPLRAERSSPAYHPYRGARALFIEVALHDTCTSSALCLRAFADPAFLAEHGVRKVVPLPSSRSDTLLCTVSPRAAVFLLLGASALGARNIIKALRLRAQE